MGVRRVLCVILVGSMSHGACAAQVENPWGSDDEPDLAIRSHLTHLAQATENQCYLAADSNDVLTIVDRNDFDPVTNETTVGVLIEGSITADDIEAIAFDPDTQTLYGANGAQIGVIDYDAATFTPLPQVAGVGDGANGPAAFSDIDGLTFDGLLNVLWGSSRKNSTGDLLFQIDVTTGAHIPDAFGPGIDYVPIEPIGLQQDADDIALDPGNRNLYAIINSGGSGEDRLARVDKQTGVTTEVGVIGISDVEGLAFDATGQLWGTSGSNALLFEIDKNTGQGTSPRALDDGDDYEAVDCFTVPAHDLQVTLTVSDPMPNQGATISYTVTVDNNGPSDATGVHLSDVLPAGVTYLTHDAAQGNYDPGSGAWAIGAVAAGAMTTLEIDVLVDAPTGDQVINTASGLAGDANDPNLANNQASVAIGTNDPPMAVDDSAVTNEEQPVIIDVLANDSDTDGGPLQVTAVGVAMNGTAVLNGDNTVTYTPDLDFQGSDSFPYTVTDSQGDSSSANVTVVVNPRPDPPVADDDLAYAETNTEVEIDVLANDSDPDGDPLAVQGVTVPGNGTVVNNGGASVTYTPDNGFMGVDNFTYTVHDGTGRTDTATVVVWVSDDSDGDGLTDQEEEDIGSDPNDADSDDDGVLDGAEPDYDQDTDGDGAINVLDPDSDDDGLFDGTETGVTEPHPDTDTSAGVFIPDADPSTTTDPLDWDTDDGTVSDGDEDSNHNGAVDQGERDPLIGEDDLQSDSDQDGIPDDLDNCVDIGNTDQLDTDGDGIGDVCDRDADGDGYDDDLGAAGGGLGGCSTGAGQGPGALGLALLAVMLLPWLLARRKRRRRMDALAVALVAGLVTVATGAGPTLGQSDSQYELERFRLSLDRNGMLDVEWGAVPRHLTVDFGMWLGYANDPLTLYRTTDDGRERVGELVSRRIGGTLVGAVGLYERFQVGLSIPLILSQAQDVGDVMGPPESIAGFGLGDLRLSPKIQLLWSERHKVDLALVAGLTLPSNTARDYFGHRQITLAPELVVSRPFSERLRAGINLGYRMRERQQTLNLQVDDEFFGRIGAGYMLRDDLEVDATVSFATGANDVFGSFNRNHSEIRAGGAYYLRDMVGFASFGVGVTEGFGTPDWRLLLGMRYSREQPEKPLLAEVPQDTDGDGITDELDKCVTEPETANGYLDADGCPDEIPDTDGDGLNDQLDKCPNDAEDMDGFQDGDGCPDADNDRDGIADEDDKCPDDAGPAANGGCPDTDRDNDTIVDRLDNCPDEPGSPENHGCIKRQLVMLTDTKLEILDKVFFQTNKAIIQSKSYGLLDNIAQVIGNHGELTLIQVEGHTDDVGTEEYNKNLSQKRAEAVVEYLVGKGVERSRLRAVGFGEEQPIEPNNSAANRATNRRVEFNLKNAQRTDDPDNGPDDDESGSEAGGESGDESGGESGGESGTSPGAAPDAQPTD